MVTVRERRLRAADSENNRREIYSGERDETDGNHGERGDQVNGPEPAVHAGRAGDSRTKSERQRPLFRKQLTSYAQSRP
jgi:hypothetical protein